MGSLEDAPDLSDEFRLLISQITGLAKITFEVVNFDRCVLPLTIDLILNGFPLSDTNSAFATSLKKFPVEVFMLFLFGAEQRWKEADAIQICGSFSFCQLTEGRKEVPMG